MKKSFKVEDFANMLDLIILHKGNKDSIVVSDTEICRPGLQFAGFFSYFEYNRVQIVGLAEYMYLEEQGPEYRDNILKKYFSYDIPCVILTRELKPHKEFMEAAKASGVTVFGAKSITTEMKQKLMYFLSDVLAPTIDRHGVLMDIYGVGVMLMGESGVGKSETALELVKRKHRLISDDAVRIKKLSPTRLIGMAPAPIKYMLEIRGIGILDVSQMYGASSVLDEKKIDLVIELEMWQPNKRYERMGLHDDNHISFLDVDIPYMLVPVRSGRNLAIVIEAAARYFILHTRGINPGNQLEERLMLNIDREELL